ncbi:response regulator [Cesiribacter andamanensis]|uniref:Nitrogen regulation protein C n=1 Tax=Cesiribacter andamanensis AMV16 TaxID=1279009 RepID=M7NQG8_9BACT|nr:response regulator transcription factor [Cesiribacter andamanensis]EMR03970.1 Nitrogen regulation protein C [Cesiribacter andamanensis AMV16]
MGGEVRIVVADDHRMVRKAWQLLLSAKQQYTVVGQAANGAEVLQLLQTMRADLVLMDLDMPVMNGFDATEQIKKRYPWIKVIGLTQQKESGYIKKLFALGASAYLTKNASDEELFEALEHVLDEKRYLSREVSDVLSKSLLTPPSEGSADQVFMGLSAREIEIVKLIASGHTTLQISNTLHLSIKTIESHRRNIFKKLQVKNVAQMIGKVKDRIV